MRQTRSTDISRVAGLYVTGEAGTLLASAGRDVELAAALLQSKGSATVTANRNLTLGTVTTSASMDATMDADNYNRSSTSSTQAIVSNLGGQNVTITSGPLRQAQGDRGDIRITASNVVGDKDVTLTAGGQWSLVAIRVSSACRSSGKF